MDEYSINNVRVVHVPLLGRDGTAHNVTRVTIYVGNDGPFTKDFPEGGDDAAVINAWKQQRVDYVRAIKG